MYKHKSNVVLKESKKKNIKIDMTAITWPPSNIDLEEAYVFVNIEPPLHLFIYWSIIYY